MEHKPQGYQTSCYLSYPIYYQKVGDSDLLHYKSHRLQVLLTQFRAVMKLTEYNKSYTNFLQDYAPSHITKIQSILYRLCLMHLTLPGSKWV